MPSTKDCGDQAWKPKRRDLIGYVEHLVDAADLNDHRVVAVLVAIDALPGRPRRCSPPRRSWACRSTSRGSSLHLLQDADHPGAHLLADLGAVLGEFDQFDVEGLAVEVGRRRAVPAPGRRRGS